MSHTESNMPSKPMQVFGAVPTPGVKDLWPMDAAATDPRSLPVLLSSCASFARDDEDALDFELMFLETVLTCRPDEASNVISQLGGLDADLQDELLPVGVISLAALRNRARRIERRVSSLVSRASGAMIVFGASLPLFGQEADAAAAGTRSAPFMVAETPVIKVVDANTGAGLAGVQIKSIDEKLLGVTDVAGQATLSEAYMETELLSLEKDGYQLYLLDRAHLSTRNVVSMKPLAASKPGVTPPQPAKAAHDGHHMPKITPPQPPKMSAPAHGHHAPAKPAAHHAPAKPAAHHAPAKPAAHHAPAKPEAHHAPAKPAAHGHHDAHAHAPTKPAVHHAPAKAAAHHAPAKPAAAHGAHAPSKPVVHAAPAAHGHDAPSAAADHGHQAAHAPAKPAAAHGHHAPAPAAVSHAAGRGHGQAAVSHGVTEVYSVRRGDTLSSLAQRYLGNAGRWSVLYQANKASLSSPHRLAVGQALVIPAAGASLVKSAAPMPSSQGYTVRSGDSLFSIAARQLGDGTKWAKIYRLNRHVVSNPRVIFPGQRLVLPN